MLDTVVDGLMEIPGRWWLLGAAAVVGVAKGARPAAKVAIKGYMAARDRLTQVSSRFGSGMQDLYQEAVAEYRSSGAATPARNAGEATTPGGQTASAAA